MGSCYSPDCADEANIVICYSPQYVGSCDHHYDELYKKFLKQRRNRNVNLHQLVDRWVKPDGSIGKITTGKASEIENRTITPEGEVINKQSKKPAQY